MKITMIIFFLVSFVCFSQETSVGADYFSFENVEYIVVDEQKNENVFYQRVYSNKFINQNKDLLKEGMAEILGDFSFSDDSFEYSYFIKTILRYDNDSFDKELLVNLDTSKLIPKDEFLSEYDYIEQVECNSSIELAKLENSLNLIRYDDYAMVIDANCNDIIFHEFNFTWKYKLHLSKDKSRLLLNCNNDYLYIWNLPNESTQN